MVTTELKREVAERLHELTEHFRTVSATALRAEVAAQEACRLICKAVEGAVLLGDLERTVQKYADLRRDHFARTPWGALNRVVAAALGDDGLERVKQQAAQLLQQEANVRRPVSAMRKGEPSYSRRLLSRLR